MYYKLVDKQVVDCTLDEYMKCKRKIARNTIWNAIISTVFLGTAHGHNDGWIPIVFETMIFWWKEDWYQERYTSYEQALEWHAKAMKLITNISK